MSGTPTTDRERLAPYCADIARACTEFRVDPFLVAGLLLRETGCGWGSGYVVPDGKPRHLGWGDSGHSFGLGQFDRRYEGTFIGSAAAQTPLGQFRHVCTILVANCREFEHSASFCSEGDLWRCAIAAYNASFGRVLHAYVTLGPQAVDGVTTGKNYAFDVLRRAAELRAAHPDLFNPAPPGDARAAATVPAAGAATHGAGDKR